MFPSRRAFSLLELLVVVAIVAILLSILMPALREGRAQARRTRCLANQRQIALGWQLYLQDNGECFYPNTCHPMIYYGGREQIYSAQRYGGCVLERRPINPYVGWELAKPDVAEIFHCPSDSGVTNLVYPDSITRTAYDFYGNSYRANSKLLSNEPGWVRPQGWPGEMPPPPLRMIHVELPPPQVVLLGDLQWYWTIWQVRLYTAYWHDRDGTKLNLAFLDGHAAYTTFDWGSEHTARYSFRYREPSLFDAGEHTDMDPRGLP